MLCGLYFGTADAVEEDISLGTTTQARQEGVEDIIPGNEMGRSSSRLSIGKFLDDLSEYPLIATAASVRSRNSTYSVFRTASVRSVLDE